MTQYYSLQKRLLLSISIPILFAGAIALSLAFKAAWHEIEEVYDAQLVHSAKVLLQLMEHELVEDGGKEDFQLQDENPNLQHKYEKNTAFRVWYNNDLTTQSTTAKIFHSLQAPPGFSDQMVDGEKWRFFVFLETENSIRIEFSERYSIRYELIGELIIALILPILILIPLIFFIIWKVTKNNLHPLRSLSADVDNRNADDLETLEVQELPTEIAPLHQAINRLFSRIQYSFEREREFTDHAAHELRTPLAAMKTQAQVLLKISTEQGAYQEGLENLLSSIDRSSLLTHQLLLLSRLQNSQYAKQKIDISTCLHEAISLLKTALNSKNITLSTRIEQPLLTMGHSGSLLIMLKNIIENAIKYTPPQGTIWINLERNGILTIIDNGPGIEESERDKVFNKFYRIKGSKEAGSGLGLSIVRWVAGAHSIEILLSANKPTGLIVSTRFCIAD